jgi:D-alanyl-D-alanine dipeptidase
MKSYFQFNLKQRNRQCKRFKNEFFATFVGPVVLAMTAAMPQGRAAPQILVDVHDIDPSLSVDMAYRGSKNFLGRRVRGYSANHCYLKDAAARALSAANARLASVSPPMKLVMRDCWRPYTATLDMQNWSATQDGKNIRVGNLSVLQADIFQDSRLFQLVDGISYLRPSRLQNFGYLAPGNSKHNRGSTVDVELYAYDSGGWRQADTGTHFDTFSQRSHFSAAVGSVARNNRTILSNAMVSEGFHVLSTEWWHWTHSTDGGEYLDGTVN